MPWKTLMGTNQKSSYIAVYFQRLFKMENNVMLVIKNVTAQ